MMRLSIFFFVSLEDQRDSLKLERLPPTFPAVVIRGPVSWKCNVQIATNRLDQVLMVNHPVLQAINYLWYQLWVWNVLLDNLCYLIIGTLIKRHKQIDGVHFMQRLLLSILKSNNIISVITYKTDGINVLLPNSNRINSKLIDFKWVLNSYFIFETDTMISSYLIQGNAIKIKYHFTLMLLLKLYKIAVWLPEM